MGLNNEFKQGIVAQIWVRLIGTTENTSTLHEKFTKIVNDEK